MDKATWIEQTAELLDRQLHDTLFYGPLKDKYRSHMKNPNGLWGSDNASFVIVRSYLHAIRTEQEGKAAFLRKENAGLSEYFDYIDHEVLRNPYYDL